MKRSIVLISVVWLYLGGAALAAESSAAKSESSSSKSDEPSKELREKMAVNHEKLAQCLRSEKPFRECREEMHEQCHDMKDDGACPMMEKMGKGMMHKHKKDNSKKENL